MIYKDQQTPKAKIRKIQMESSQPVQSMSSGIRIEFRRSFLDSFPPYDWTLKSVLGFMTEVCGALSCCWSVELHFRLVQRLYSSPADILCELWESCGIKCLFNASLFETETGAFLRFNICYLISCFFFVLFLTKHFSDVSCFCPVDFHL